MYQPACDLPERGYFFRPTLFTNVAQSHRIAREEIFGPVLSVLTFRTPDEAVETANNPEYGLPAGGGTGEGGRGLWTERQHTAGVVVADRSEQHARPPAYRGAHDYSAAPRGGRCPQAVSNSAFSYGNCAKRAVRLAWAWFATLEQCGRRLPQDCRGSEVAKMRPPQSASERIEAVKRRHAEPVFAS